MIEIQEAEFVQQLGTIIEDKIDEKLSKVQTQPRSKLSKLWKRTPNLQYQNPTADPPAGDPIIDREYTRELKGGKVTTTINLIFIKREFTRELGPGKVTLRVKLWLQQIRSMMLLSVFCIGMLWLTVSGGSAIIPYLLRLLELLPIMILAPALLVIPVGLGLSYAYVNTAYQ